VESLRVLGLPLPSCEIVNEDASSIVTTAELKVRHACHEEPCAAGLQFGTGFLGGTLPGLTPVNYLPEGHLSEVSNLRDFHGALVFDKWTGNADGRQAVFCRKHRGVRFKAWFID